MLKYLSQKVTQEYYGLVMEVYIIFAFLGLWLLILSILVFRQILFLRKFTKGTNEKDLIKVLKRIIEKEDLNAKESDKLRRELIHLEEEVLGHVQKIGIVRFNPFRETGGDHSFSLAVLDGTNSGFVVTGLHTRERTRLYLKEIIKGVSQTELSKEEEKALVAAQKQ